MNAIDIRPLFPFSALLGQDTLQRALLLVAIDPGIGGVLIEGPRGTAKSTGARALAELLPSGRLVTLPLGASAEQLIGSLDIEAALQGGTVNFAPGLLAKAHEGALYVDEVNLLPDALVDQLLDVAASGVNVIERDGISHTHPARFVLIGTMNREEGELRPQLLDRFGLALALANTGGAAQRRAIVEARLAFDADPAAFRAGFNAQQQQLAATLVRARAALAQLHFDAAVHDRAAQLCAAAGVDGVRADLAMLRAARALAALQGDSAVTPAHIDAIADLALHHRRNTPPPAAQSTAAPAQSPPRDNNGQQQPAQHSAHPSEPDSGHDDADNPWGELPPEPVAPQAVKGVRPLPPKKR